MGRLLRGHQRWKERGINIDGVWRRTVGEIDSALDGWLSGEITPVNLVWTIWGYHILTDINNQFAIEDPYQIIGDWKERLSVYPPALKQAILGKYAASLRYWRSDYHYAHKVERGDVVFLAGMASKLVHESIQILFALNETYFRRRLEPESYREVQDRPGRLLGQGSRSSTLVLPTSSLASTRLCLR